MEPLLKLSLSPYSNYSNPPVSVARVVTATCVRILLLFNGMSCDYSSLFSFMNRARLDVMLAEKKIKTQRSIFIEKGWAVHKSEKRLRGERKTLLHSISLPLLYPVSCLVLIRLQY